MGKLIKIKTKHLPYKDKADYKKESDKRLKILRLTKELRKKKKYVRDSQDLILAMTLWRLATFNLLPLWVIKSRYYRNNPREVLILCLKPNISLPKKVNHLIKHQIITITVHTESLHVTDLSLYIQHRIIH